VLSSTDIQQCFFFVLSAVLPAKLESFMGEAGATQVPFAALAVAGSTKLLKARLTVKNALTEKRPPKSAL
jgi:hypothetical protein